MLNWHSVQVVGFREAPKSIMVRIPRKLKTDPITEAIFEIRFHTGSIPEVVFGQIATLWKGGITKRLPLADIPAPIRNNDPTLRVQPTIEIRIPESGRVIKIGDRVLSYHVFGPYPGWISLSKELSGILEKLFLLDIEGFETERLGLRYVNVFKTADHLVSGIGSLNVRIDVSGESVRPPLNINYGKRLDRMYLALVRLASPEFVTTNTNHDLAALVDIDIYSPDGESPAVLADILKWIEAAHLFLKNEFYGLFTPAMFNNLVEEW